MHDDPYLDQIGADNYLRQKEIDRIWRENPPTELWHWVVLLGLGAIVIIPLLIHG